MTRYHSPLQQLKEAKQIARDHGLFVIEKPDGRGNTAYLLYREHRPGNGQHDQDRARLVVPQIVPHFV